MYMLERIFSNGKSTTMAVSRNPNSLKNYNRFTAEFQWIALEDNEFICLDDHISTNQWKIRRVMEMP